MGKYAVNVCDLSDCFPMPLMAILLMGNFCSAQSPTVTVDKGRVDTSAVILDGPAAQDDKRVKGLIELLQTVIGPRKMGRRVRVYREGPRGGWKEVR